MVSIKSVLCLLLVAVLAVVADARIKFPKFGGFKTKGSRGFNKGVNRSSASCKAVSITETAIFGKEANAACVAKASSYLCSKKTNEKNWDVASCTAKAFSLAVAKAAAKVTCKLSGYASAEASAYGKAKAAAKVWLTAYSKAVAKSEVCGNCNAVAKFVARAQEKVFLKAVASASATIKKSIKGGNYKKKEQDIAKAVDKAVVKAFAKAVADARQGKDKLGSTKTCFTKVKGVVKTPGTKCTVESLSRADILEFSEVNKAVAKLKVFACTGKIKIKAKAAARAFAKALAAVVSKSFAKCKVTGKGYACVDKNFTNASAHAEATAKAIIKLWVRAKTCYCKVKVDKTAKAVGDIFSEAFSNSFATGCQNGKGFFKESAIFGFIADTTLDATAKVLVKAVAGRKCFGKATDKSSKKIKTTGKVLP